MRVCTCILFPLSCTKTSNSWWFIQRKISRINYTSPPLPLVKSKNFSHAEVLNERTFVCSLVRLIALIVTLLHIMRIHYHGIKSRYTFISLCTISYNYFIIIYTCITYRLFYISTQYIMDTSHY